MVFNIVLSLLFFQNVVSATEPVCENSLRALEAAIEQNEAGVLSFDLMPQNARRRLLKEQFGPLIEFLDQAVGDPPVSEVIQGRVIPSEVDWTALQIRYAAAIPPEIANPADVRRFMADVSDLLVIHRRRDHQRLIELSDRLLEEYGVPKLSEISQLDQSKVSLVFFTMRPCQPCEELKPDFARMSAYFSRRGVDTWYSDNLELAKRYGIKTFPAFVAFKGEHYVASQFVVDSTAGFASALKSLSEVTEKTSQSAVMLFDDHGAGSGYGLFSAQSADEVADLRERNFFGQPIEKEPLFSVPQSHVGLMERIRETVAPDRVGRLLNPPPDSWMNRVIETRPHVRPGRLSVVVVSQQDCMTCDPLMDPVVEIADLMSGRADVYVSNKRELAHGLFSGRRPTIVIYGEFSEIIAVAPYESSAELQEMLVRTLVASETFSGLGFYVKQSAFPAGALLRLLSPTPPDLLYDRLESATQGGTHFSALSVYKK